MMDKKVTFHYKHELHFQFQKMEIHKTKKPYPINKWGLENYEKIKTTQLSYSKFKKWN